MTEPHQIASHPQWIEARKQLLAKEKEFTKARDELNAQRRAMPWLAVEKDYVFDGADGKKTLVELFGGHSQLIVYHFMFAPDWEAGCPHCSFWADNFNPVIVHLNHRDAAMAAISRAPYAKLAAYQKRMGWSFAWYSSGENTFNYDYGVSFTPQEIAAKQAYYNFDWRDPGPEEREGVSVFARDAAGHVFHTYSTYARGIDLMNTAYNYIDLTPKGRDEGERTQYWVRRHDEYED